MILLVRTLHGIITAFFLTCIGYIYYAGITNQVTLLTYLAIGAIILEGVVVSLNNGNCPLGPLHHRYGDEKAFFELFLSKPAAKRAVPVLGLVAAIGILLVIF